MWNKICRVDMRFVGMMWALLGILFVETFIGSLGCDCWAWKISVHGSESGLKRWSPTTSRVTVYHCWALLMDIAKNCMETSEQKCHGKFTNLLVTWWRSSLPSSELKALLWVIIKMFTLRGGKIFHAYPCCPQHFSWLPIPLNFSPLRLRCSTFG